MKKNPTTMLRIFIYGFLIISLFSCTDKDPLPEDQQEEMELEEEVEEEEQENPEITSETIDGDMGTVTYFDKNRVEDHYILVNDAMSNRVYLMDKNANIVYEWPLGDRKIGNDVLLLEDGILLASLQADNPEIQFGGFGGRMQFIAKNGDALWDYTYSNREHRSHHDIELLPNGNVIAIAWELMTMEEAIENGSQFETDLYPESVIEINPNTDEIVWEWHAKDHLIQDYDESKLNYGSVEENPQLIDLNYTKTGDSNIMHVNGIGYDALNDLIYLSVNYYSEVWIIDHSTTTEEATENSGGNFGKGGDLIYRFGNPTTLKDNTSERLFINNHFPNLFEPSKMLIFTNGGELGQSTVYELNLPEELNQQEVPELSFPEIAWSFTDSELFSPKVSGAVRLPNGNTLITEGDFGMWEVTNEGEVVWQFSGQGFFWRAYHYAKDDPAILALDL